MGTNLGSVNVSSMLVAAGWKYGKLCRRPGFSGTEVNPVTAIKAHPFEPYRLLIGFRQNVAMIWNLKVRGELKK